ncbi:hypothetical protein AVEN_138097-1 [Araneus ventricosus]|uniref:Uncharacterized protein n=1 Tax=Araneus ventricosus TaxID=182803 RepID=A0A4Y2QIK7_ARAVE|nr:hypothetical protein AVEN_138097-1 [Araneus ventricosus]
MEMAHLGPAVVVESELSLQCERVEDAEGRSTWPLILEPSVKIPKEDRAGGPSSCQTGKCHPHKLEIRNSCPKSISRASLIMSSQKCQVDPLGHPIKYSLGKLCLVLNEMDLPSWKVEEVFLDRPFFKIMKYQWPPYSLKSTLNIE